MNSPSQTNKNQSAGSSQPAQTALAVHPAQPVPTAARQSILPAVAMAVFNEQGEVLLQKRRDTGQWCVLSGHVEFGETLEQAALREIIEETRIPARILRLIGVYSSPESQLYQYGDHAVQYITSYFEATLEGGIDPAFSNEETLALRFFPAGNLPAEMARISPHWLDDALDREHAPFIR